MWNFFQVSVQVTYRVSDMQCRVSVRILFGVCDCVCVNVMYELCVLCSVDLKLEAVAWKLLWFGQLKLSIGMTFSTLLISIWEESLDNLLA